MTSDVSCGAMKTVVHACARWLTQALALLAPARALADHGAGAGGSAGAAGPIAVALVWGGAAFVVGMLVVAAIARLARRKPEDS
jgi:hypothetical protein